MAEFLTEHFGKIEYDSSQVIHFPAGLPAFEQERRFVSIERPATAPVVFLQSLSRTELMFITLPVLVVDATYQLKVSPEDLQALELPDDRQPELGADVACLAVITVAESSPATANLMAPIVINLRTRCALQAIQAGTAYSHAHPLPATAEERKC